MNKPIITLRDMMEEDVELVVQARNESKEYLTDTNDITLEQGKKFWKSFVKPGLVSVWIIRKDGIACGYVDYKWIECNIGIKILEKYRGGIGRTALQLAFKCIRDLNERQEITADVKNTNMRMINTAFKCGFELVEKDEKYHRYRVPLRSKE